MQIKTTRDTTALPLAWFGILYFLAVLGLRCSMRTFSSCRARALELAGSAAAELRLSSCGAQASLIAVHGLSSCRAQAQYPQHMGTIVMVYRFSCPTTCGILIPRPRIEPMSPAMEGGFLTTGPAGKFPQGWL